MARVAHDEFDGKAVSRVYIAGTLAEAERVVYVLAGQAHSAGNGSAGPVSPPAWWTSRLRS